MKNLLKILFPFLTLVFTNKVFSQAVNTLYLSNGQDGRVYNISLLNGTLPVPVSTYSPDSSASNLAVGPNPSNLLQYVFTHSDVTNGSTVYQNGTSVGALPATIGGLTANPVNGHTYGITSSRQLVRANPTAAVLGIITAAVATDTVWGTSTVASDSFFDNFGNMYTVATNGSNRYIYRIDITTLKATRYLTLSGTLPTNFQGLAFYDGNIYATEGFSSSILAFSWNNARIYRINPTTGASVSAATYQLNTFLGPFPSADNLDLASTDLFSPPTSDLVVTKTVNNPTPVAGTNVIFTITGNNNGSNDDTNVIVNDLLPTGYTYVSHTTASGTYNNATGVWSIGNLNTGASASLQITATVNATGNYTNTATISGTNVDPNLNNNTANATITLFDPCTISASNPDSDGDGISNACDLDDDNDGILDSIENNCTDIPTNRTFTGGTGISTATVAGWTLSNSTVYYEPTLIQFDQNKVTQTLTSSAVPATGYVWDTVHKINVKIKSLKANGATVGGANLEIRFGGVTYATLVSPNGSSPGATIVTYSNGATGNTTAITQVLNANSGTIPFTDLEIYIPSSVTLPGKAISFVFNSNALGAANDDYNVDEVSIAALCDFDGDGIANIYDLDSDNDGCTDAIEGGAAITTSQLVSSGGTVTVGTGSSASNQNLCGGSTCVDANGVPTIVGASGQTVGDSQDSSNSSQCLDYDGDLVPDWQDLDDDNDGILDTDECGSTDRVANGVFPTTGGNTDTVPGWTVGGTYSATWPSNIGRVNLGTDGLQFRRDQSTNTTLSQSISGVLSGSRILVNQINWTKTAANTASGNFTLQISYGGVVYATIASTSNTTGPSITPSNGATVNINSLPDLLTEPVYTRSNKVDLIINLPFSAPTSGVLLFTFNAGTDATEVRDIAIMSVQVLSSCRDTDSDGTPDYLDTDSDNDGCPDAIEGGDNVLPSQVNTYPATGIVFPQGSINTQANGTSNGTVAVVDANGVPVLVNTGGLANVTLPQGQSVGTSVDGIPSAACITVCYETPSNLTSSVPVKHGITILGRAGADNGNWPMVRNSAYTVLEGKAKGFVITRIADPETSIVNPIVGMMVFDTDAPGVNGATGCLKIYTGSGAGEGWKCFNTQGCP